MHTEKQMKYKVPPYILYIKDSRAVYKALFITHYTITFIVHDISYINGKNCTRPIKDKES